MPKRLKGEDFVCSGKGEGGGGGKNGGGQDGRCVREVEDRGMRILKVLGGGKLPKKFRPRGLK